MRCTIKLTDFELQMGLVYKDHALTKTLWIFPQEPIICRINYNEIYV